MGNRLSAVALTTGLVALNASVGQAAELSFATPEGLFRLGASGGDRQMLMPSSDRFFNALAWSADGQHLAVVQNDSDVYRVMPGGGSPELVFTSDCPRPRPWPWPGRPPAQPW